MKNVETAAQVYDAILSIDELKQVVKIDNSYKPTKITVLVLSQVIDAALEKGNEKGNDLLSYLPAEAEALRKFSDYLLEKAGFKNLAQHLKNLK
jgi:N-acetylglucosamine kinase-like BadF-type ATPase